MLGGEVEDLFGDFASFLSVSFDEKFERERPCEIVGFPFDETIDEIWRMEVENAPINDIIISARRIESHSSMSVEFIYLLARRYG